jgi:hypothetical protein
MGPSHVMSGAAIWLGGVALYSNATHTPITPAILLLGTAVAAGAAALPDLDSNSSTIVRSLGIFGKLLYHLVTVVSVTAYEATRTSKDDPAKGGHRTLFHTGIAAIVAGGVTALLTTIASPISFWGAKLTGGQLIGLIIMGILLNVALAGLFGHFIKKLRSSFGPYLLLLISFGLTVGLAFALPAGNGKTYAWLGLAVGGGWMVHLLGDAITKMGVPMWWPLKIHGRRWWDIALPTFMRIKAGGTFELVILFPLFTIASIALFIYDWVLYLGLIKG